jgi:hypothetical protein
MPPCPTSSPCKVPPGEPRSLHLPCQISKVPRVSFATGKPKAPLPGLVPAINDSVPGSRDGSAASWPITTSRGDTTGIISWPHFDFCRHLGRTEATESVFGIQSSLFPHEWKRREDGRENGAQEPGSHKEEGGDRGGPRRLAVWQLRSPTECQTFSPQTQQSPALHTRQFEI